MDLEAIKVLLNSQERTLRSAMDIVVKQLQDRIIKAEKSVEEVIKSLEFSQAEVLDLKNEVEVLVKSNKDKQLMIADLQSKVHEQEQRLNYQEDYSRRNNLRITGFRELPGGETWEETTLKVNKLLEDKLQLPAANLERAHRVGKTNSSYPRPIVVRFVKFSDREAAIRNAKKLKGTGIYLNEDLCPASMELRKNQLPLLKKARDEGKIAYFRHTRLIIRERTGQRTPVPADASSVGVSVDDASSAEGAGGRARSHDGVGTAGSATVDGDSCAEGAVGWSLSCGGDGVRSSSTRPSTGDKGAAKLSTWATSRRESTEGTAVRNQKGLRDRRKK